MDGATERAIVRAGVPGESVGAGVPTGKRLVPPRLFCLLGFLGMIRSRFSSREIGGETSTIFCLLLLLALLQGKKVASVENGGIGVWQSLPSRQW